MCSLENEQLRFQYICLGCFSNGHENQTHKNTHSYRVINMTELETFDGWNLHQEIKRINKLADYHEITHFKKITEQKSNLIPNEYVLSIDDFEHEECIEHSDNWLSLLNDNYERLDPIRVNKNRVKTTQVLFKDVNINDFSSTGYNNRNLTSPNFSLIRPQILSKQYRLMNGYRPARNDFETEYNDKFELNYIADLDFESVFTENEENDGSELETSSSEIEVEELGCQNVETYSEEDCQIENLLKLEILRSYNDLLRERDERKRFVRRFGLMSELTQNEYALTLLMNKNLNNSLKNYLPFTKHQKFDHYYIQDCFTHLQKIKTDSQWSPMQKFHRLFNDLDNFTKCVELFAHQAYLKKKLDDLREYRANGVRSLKHVSIYKNLKLKRLNRASSVHLGSLLTVLNRYDDYSDSFYCKTICQDWFKKLALSDKNFKPKYLTNDSNHKENEAEKAQFADSPDISSPKNPSAYPASHLKYKNNPLKIENYPDWEKLDEDEREFCRVARVQPSVYLRVKAILVLENTKAGFCTYARARKIAGIDVNKTRLIHSLLLKLELIKATQPQEQK